MDVPEYPDEVWRLLEYAANCDSPCRIEAEPWPSPQDIARVRKSLARSIKAEPWPTLQNIEKVNECAKLS